MVEEGTGRMPLIYFSYDDACLILGVARGGTIDAPQSYGVLERVDLPAFAPAFHSTPPTDDWPFLYLSGPHIPGDYLTVIATLMLLSIGAIVTMRTRGDGWADLHFLALGVGFLLLETKSIRDCTLYFGATWFVTWVVVTGVLLMVFVANLVAMRLSRFHVGLYAPLLGALAVLVLTPPDAVLGWDFAWRILWALLVMPLPIFFAGLIFSTTLRNSPNPAASFGANLIGAVIGGFCEYLAMLTGNSSLLLLVIAAYLVSFGCQGRVARA